MPMPDSPLRAEARQALQARMAFQARMVPPAGWAASQLSALDAISRALRELTGSLAGFQNAWQAAARQALAATMTTSSAARESARPRCWRCEISPPPDAAFSLAGPSESGLRVDLCDACLAYMADPGASSDRAIAEHDQIARRQLKDREEDRATAERRAVVQGLGGVDEDA